ncbi:hypothetical protein MAR_030456, partial [Mya arenaria]
MNVAKGLRGMNVAKGFCGMNVAEGLRGMNVAEGLRGMKVAEGLHGMNVAEGFELSTLHLHEILKMPECPVKCPTFLHEADDICVFRVENVHTVHGDENLTFPQTCLLCWAF